MTTDDLVQGAPQRGPDGEDEPHRSPMALPSQDIVEKRNCSRRSRPFCRQLVESVEDGDHQTLAHQASRCGARQLKGVLETAGDPGVEICFVLPLRGRDDQRHAAGFQVEQVSRDPQAGVRLAASRRADDDQPIVEPEQRHPGQVLEPRLGVPAPERQVDLLTAESEGVEAPADIISH